MGLLHWTRYDRGTLAEHELFASSLSCRRQQFDDISFARVARTEDVRIETESSTEPADDVAQDVGILFSGVGVVSGHDATAAKIDDPDHRVRQSQRGPGPVPLVSPIYALDEEVRTEPSDIATQHRHGAVRADEERQNVESVRAIKPCEPRTRRDSSLNPRGDFGRIPRQSVHQRFAVRAERRAESEESREPSRRDDPAVRVVHLHYSIADEPSTG